MFVRDGLASQTILNYFHAFSSFSFADKGFCPMVMKLQFVLLLLCLPAVLAFPRPAGEEGKEEERSEGTDDGELEEEEEEEEDGEDDELEDKELSPPDHIAGAPLERDGHLNTVSVCLRACMYVTSMSYVSALVFMCLSMCMHVCVCVCCVFVRACLFLGSFVCIL